MAEPPLIELTNITRVYGTGEIAVRALDGINLTVEAGEFIAIMGPSGSGKSTAMNVLGCLDSPTSGEYRFNGVEVGNLSRDQRAPAKHVHEGEGQHHAGWRLRGRRQCQAQRLQAGFDLSHAQSPFVSCAVPAQAACTAPRNSRGKGWPLAAAFAMAMRWFMSAAR